jgi:hypothetical protein
MIKILFIAQIYEVLFSGRSHVAEVFISNRVNCYNEVVCSAISFVLLQEFGFKIGKTEQQQKKDATPPTNALVSENISV